MGWLLLGFCAHLHKLILNSKENDDVTNCVLLLIFHRGGTNKSVSGLLGNVDLFWEVSHLGRPGPTYSGSGAVDAPVRRYFVCSVWIMRWNLHGHFFWTSYLYFCTD